MAAFRPSGCFHKRGQNLAYYPLIAHNGHGVTHRKPITGFLVEEEVRELQAVLGGDE
jgi:hypothetical protein